MPPSRLVSSIVVALALNLAVCPANNSETPAPPTILIQETDYRGVIFSAAEAEQQRLEVPMTADTVEFWSPTAADIARLEAQLLPALLTDERLSDGVGFNPVQPLTAALPDYTRQYFGYFNTDDEAVIYTRFYCDTSAEELTMSSSVPPLDGGDCFFQIHYNTNTDEYFGLYVHGEA
ncbi:MAG: hypothetical protein AAGH67_10560 [Cyanobacteria bacterium P01_H01_bin.162]